MFSLRIALLVCSVFVLIGLFFFTPSGRQLLSTWVQAIGFRKIYNAKSSSDKPRHKKRLTRFHPFEGDGDKSIKISADKNITPAMDSLEYDRVENRDLHNDHDDFDFSTESSEEKIIHRHSNEDNELDAHEDDDEDSVIQDRLAHQTNHESTDDDNALVGEEEHKTHHQAVNKEQKRLHNVDFPVLSDSVAEPQNHAHHHDKRPSMVMNALKDLRLEQAPRLSVHDPLDIKLSDPLVIDYEAFIKNNISEVLKARYESNTLVDIAYKQRLELLKSWFTAARSMLGDVFVLRFINADNSLLETEAVLLKAKTFDNKLLIKQLIHADVMVCLKLCAKDSSMDVDTIKSFQQECFKLAALYQSEANYLLSDAKLYQTIQKIDVVKRNMDKIFIIQLNAKEGNSFQGRQIKSLALQNGYHYGFRKVFHKYQQEAPEMGKAYMPYHGYSMLNRYAPGHFEFERLNEMETKGICLITKPILSDRPEQLMQEFVAEAIRIQQVLNAALYIPRSNFADREDHDKINHDINARHFDKELQDYLKSLIDVGVAPGSEAAQRLFGFN